MTDLWPVIGVGVALAGLQWRLHASLSGRFDRMEARFDRMQADLTSVKERLTAVETTLDLLIKGLHIEVKERG